MESTRELGYLGAVRCSIHTRAEPSVERARRVCLHAHSCSSNEQRQAIACTWLVPASNANPWPFCLRDLSRHEASASCRGALYRGAVPRRQTQTRSGTGRTGSSARGARSSRRRAGISGSEAAPSGGGQGAGRAVKERFGTKSGYKSGPCAISEYEVIAEHKLLPTPQQVSNKA